MDVDSRLSDVGRTVPVDHDIGYYVMLSARAFARIAEARLRPLGLGVAHVPVLVALAQAGASTQKQLARRLQVEQPTAAALLQRMEAAGLIDRTPDPTDRRSARIALTDSGTQVLPEALRMRAAAVHKAVAGLTSEEVSVLENLLRRVLVNLDAQVAAPE